MELYCESVRSLIKSCEHELDGLEYNIYRHRKISAYWVEFAQWAEHRGIEEFSDEIGSRYCFEEIGSDILSGIEKHDQLKLRSIRMLMSYHRKRQVFYVIPSYIGAMYNIMKFQPPELFL